MTAQTTMDYPHRRKHPLPTAAEIRARYSYDPATGIVTGPRGRPISAKGGQGYIVTRTPSANGTSLQMMAHRIAYVLMTGHWPNIIDHINGDRLDNRWNNLRNVTPSENARNRPGIGMAPGLFKVRCKTRKQGFSWHVYVRAGDTATHNAYRNFCTAWKRRRKLLADSASAPAIRAKPRAAQSTDTRHGAYKQNRPPPDIAVLRDKFHYDPETGTIIGPSGRTVGSRQKDGYSYIGLNFGPYRTSLAAHRLAFALQTGTWPNIIDHINRDKSDNRWTNLRDVTARENMRNTPPRKPVQPNGVWGRFIYRHTGSAKRPRPGWQVHMFFGGRHHGGTYNHFCTAWKRRHDLLVKRDAITAPPEIETPSAEQEPRQKARIARPLALWAWADRTATE